MPDGTDKKPSRIQQRNRRAILDAALEVFSRHGFRGSTLDQIAHEAGLSKPNLLYYFEGKEHIHLTLLSQLMETWLDPLVMLNPDGDPVAEILSYVQRKLDMARAFPRESRLFANEILQGAPRMRPELETTLKTLFDDKCALLQNWIDSGRLPPIDPKHLIFSIWATTQHYADFETQIRVLIDDGSDPYDAANAHLQAMFSAFLNQAH